MTTRAKKPSTAQAAFPFTHHAETPRQRTFHTTPVGTAREAVGVLVPGAEVFGLTKGQFSLMDLMLALLNQTGPAHVTIATWTAAKADMAAARKLLDSGQLPSLRWIVDYSFPARQPEYCAELIERFGVDSIRVTFTHAKFALLRNERWNLAVRTSMNLNVNPRLESFEYSDDPALADYLGAVADEIFARHDVACPAPEYRRTTEQWRGLLGADAGQEKARVDPVGDADYEAGRLLALAESRGLPD